jgi:WD40 repeat protein
VPFKALAVSPDGRVLATGIDNGRLAGPRELAIRRWDVAARKELGRVPAHRSYIRALAFSADGRRLVSASEDSTALVWDVEQIIGRRAAATEPRGSAVRRQ